MSASGTSPVLSRFASRGAPSSSSNPGTLGAHKVKPIIPTSVKVGAAIPIVLAVILATATILALLGQFPCSTNGMWAMGGIAVILTICSVASIVYLVKRYQKEKANRAATASPAQSAPAQVQAPTSSRTQALAPDPDADVVLLDDEADPVQMLMGLASMAVPFPGECVDEEGRTVVLPPGTTRIEPFSVFLRIEGGRVPSGLPQSGIRITNRFIRIFEKADGKEYLTRWRYIGDEIVFPPGTSLSDEIERRIDRVSTTSYVIPGGYLTPPGFNPWRVT